MRNTIFAIILSAALFSVVACGSIDMGEELVGGLTATEWEELHELEDAEAMGEFDGLKKSGTVVIDSMYLTPVPLPLNYNPGNFHATF